MTERATFTLDGEAFDFLRASAGNNRSAYISRLLREEKKRSLEKKLLQANREEAEDADYRKELAAWDATLLDGLE